MQTAQMANPAMGNMSAAIDDGEWVNAMDEEAKKGGSFFKMLPTDQKVITALSNPKKGLSSYDLKNMQQNPQAPAKQPRTSFTMKVLVDGEEGEKTWEFSHRGIMQQFVAEAKKYSLKSIVNCKFIVKTTGTTSQNKSWFIMLIAAPGITIQMPQVQTPQAQWPTNGQVQQMDRGQQWLEEQKRGVAQ